MIWWVIIPAVIVAALGYAYWEHNKVSRRLATLFAPLAAANSGDVKAATVLALPVLRFERDGRRYVVGAMANGGPLVSGTASRPGFNGPFTFANLELPFDTGQELRIQRSDKLDRGISRTIASVTNGQRPNSGDDEFDNKYLIKTRGQASPDPGPRASLKRVARKAPSSEG